MSDLLWPGSERAGHHLEDAAVLAAMVRVEQAWLDALVASGTAPERAAADLADLAGEDDLAALALAAETGGTAVIPLVELLRSRVDGPAATWLHRGLTSQDVVDSAVMLEVRDAVEELCSHLRQAGHALAALAQEHRATTMAGRTLTQHAVPVTFGLVASGWLAGILDAYEELRTLRFPVQVGGAAGTRAALWQLAGPDRGRQVVARLAGDLGLSEAWPWHTVRAPWTRIGDAVVSATDACGHLAADVLALSRPEVGELREGRPGGSSTMPDKANPVLATLVRRAALTTPALAAQLHLAAADTHDQRPAGAWHTEGVVLRDLVRRALTAADQTAELVAGLQVDAAAMGERAAAAYDRLRAEQAAVVAVAGGDPDPSYLGQTDELVAAVLDRARDVLEEDPT